MTLNHQDLKEKMNLRLVNVKNYINFQSICVGQDQLKLFPV